MSVSDVVGRPREIRRLSGTRCASSYVNAGCFGLFSAFCCCVERLWEGGEEDEADVGGEEEGGDFWLGWLAGDELVDVDEVEVGCAEILLGLEEGEPAELGLDGL